MAFKLLQWNKTVCDSPKNLFIHVIYIPSKDEKLATIVIRITNVAHKCRKWLHQRFLIIKTAAINGVAARAVVVNKITSL